MNITIGVGLLYSSKEKIYQTYNEALYALNQRLIQGWNRAYFYKNMDGYEARIGKEEEILFAFKEVYPCMIRTSDTEVNDYKIYGKEFALSCSESEFKEHFKLIKHQPNHKK